MQEVRSFAPLYKKAVVPNSGSLVQGSLITSTTVTASEASATASGQIQGAGRTNNNFCQIQISNTTSAWAYVNFGSLSIAAVTAATVAASYPVGPGATVVVTVDPEVDGASVILGAAPSGSALVTFTRGGGT